MKLGLQLYSVRENLEKDFLGTLKKVREMGYEGGELSGIYGNSAKDVKAMFEEADLIPISAHVSYQDLMVDIEETVKTYYEIGCKYIAIPYLPEDLRYGTEKYPEVVANIKKIGEVCNKYGIELLYHNHDFEFAKTENGEYALDELYNEISADLLKTEIDTCWVNVGGEEPAKYIEKYSGRAPVVHLKDFYMSGKGKPAKLYQLIGIDDGAQDAEEEEAFGFRPCGYGVQNFPAILEACKKAGTSWVVVEQDQPSLGKTPVECAQMSIDYIKDINK